MGKALRDVRPSGVALAVLVGLVVLSPWPFGSAHPGLAHGIAVTALATSFLLLLPPGLSSDRFFPRLILWPLVGLWLLGCLQLVPCPKPLLEAVARGPSAVWYPAQAAAADVLGPGPHPLSICPEATARGLAFATSLLLLTLLAAPALRERRTLMRVSVAVVCGGVLVAVYGLVARVVFGDKLYGFLTVPTIAPFGPFVSKNHFAGYIEMAACLAAGLASGLAEEAHRERGTLGWLDSPRAARVVFSWGAAAVLVLAVPVSLSRGGAVSLTAGLVAFTLVRIADRRRAEVRPRALAFAAACLMVLGVGVAWVLPPEARSRISTLAGTNPGGPDSFRLGVWRDSLRLAASSPLLGFGLGAFEDALPPFKTGAGDQRVEHAESDYVELLVEGGLVASGPAALLAAGVLLAGLRCVRDEPHRVSRGLRAGALSGVAALLVHSAFDFNLRIPSNALLFCLLVAMLLHSDAAGVAGSAGADGSRRWPRPRLALLPLVATTLALSFSIPWAPRRFDSAHLARAAGSFDGALRRQFLEREVVEHLRRRPADAPAWVALAWLRRPASPLEAAALASRAVSLDPQHVALRRAAESVAGVQIQPRRP